MPASCCLEQSAVHRRARHLGRLWQAACLALACLLGAPAALAHKASDAYLHLSRQGDLLALRWDVALRDLDSALALDANGDGQLTWGELKARRADIEAHLLGRLRLQPLGANQACALRVAPLDAPLERRTDGAYFVLKLAGLCALPQGQLSLRYRLLAEIDPTHRGLLQVAGQSGQVWSLDPSGRDLSVRVPDATPVAQGPSSILRAAYTPTLPTPPLPDAASAIGTANGQLGDSSNSSSSLPHGEADAPSGFTAMVRDGVHHILIGTDHVLFLLCLLLPAVLRPSADLCQRPSEPVTGLAQALRPVLLTVTTFTLAHSLTLALAALGIVQPSPRLVEPAIALTIALAAFDNIRPVLRGWRHAFTFLFGLVHGFGFAGVLHELDLPTEGFVKALLGFNLGVELGQLLIVLPALAMLMLLRRHGAYAHRLMPMGSALAIVVALGWFVERAFDLGFMPV